jgi:DIS3-like exonuclease 2
LEIGVHISDVSFFVKENTSLDNVVKDRATTIYLVDSVYHMLPEKLCLLCSLMPGKDKMVIFISSDYKRFGKSMTRNTLHSK